ncbi:4Fe-4S binding protein [Oscillatoriales cyanobacterium LEGE 11467]|uniref:4Fe-4S binding protein n=1 Tax=Zarconia navalis LEGE 11467 TaxID=1828826 RepID=A0A928W1P4_9CYAN|nr:4Fe-4S binding protein [Zarconia navalis]MBE9041625.1 4Fe-4S binding protein [Zarconia navalis LEGE 11467]
MLTQVSERTMHSVRWMLVIGWLLLIISLFYDPISPILTDPRNLMSPWHDPALYRCIKVQGTCLEEHLYPLGARIFWGTIVPSGIAIVFVLGHEFWRRICPLYFFSQIPRALGWQPKLNIQKNQWLLKNHLYVQFAFLFVGLSCRILFVNSDRRILGCFLIGTILAAIAVVFLYGGRSWCHYVCPFGLVQTIFTGTRGLLGSQAHTVSDRMVTQSMCRTIDPITKKDKPACIGCKSPCLDIDAERAYWQDLGQS